jgi:hypothetical protein
VRVRLNSRDLVRTRGLGLDTGDGIHDRWHILRGCVEPAQWKTFQQELVCIENLRCIQWGRCRLSIHLRRGGPVFHACGWGAVTEGPALVINGDRFPPHPLVLSRHQLL